MGSNISDIIGGHDADGSDRGAHNGRREKLPRPCRVEFPEPFVDLALELAKTPVELRRQVLFGYRVLDGQ